MLTRRRTYLAVFAGLAILALPTVGITTLTRPRGLAAQGVPQLATLTTPDPSRFNVVTLVPMGELDEPMTFAVAKDGRVFINERRTGHIKVFNPQGNTTTTVGTIPINHTYTSANGVGREAEEGFIGLTLDPNFDQNHWMYILYADPDVSKHVLARIELRDEISAAGDRTSRIVPNSYKTVLEYGAQREVCCHTGGGMTWDAQGNLYIAVGNNTGNTGTSQTDERPGRSNWDDQRGAANTNNLLGKILRIRPQPDGTYTIPPGNLFPPGTPGTRPEIYTMGHRNVWRPSIDSRTGYLYWGEVGPDNQADNPQVGPRGYDELNQAKGPGFFGWPYFVGPNAAFPIRDYVNGRVLGPKDPARPTNTSVNNTGLTTLPPAQPAFIGYEYGISEKFPEVGAGGRCAVGGPVYRRADFAANAARPWPAYFEGRWLATDCSRAWIMAIAMDADGNYASMERLVLPNQRFSEPMDLKFGPEGDLYLLDYGGTWFAKSEDARLVRIEYNGGNRAPVVMASASRSGGAVPFAVTLSSAGTKDHDGDVLQYEWTVTAPGSGTRVLREPNPTLTFDRAGVYTATLAVTDSRRARSTASVDIVGGNEPPAVDLGVSGGLNRTFFSPGAPISYAVKVTDKEDAAVSADQIAFSINYVPEGFDVAAIRQGQQKVDPTTRFAVAKALIAKSDCAVCHSPTATSLGPSLPQLAAKYTPDPATVNALAAKVRNGGTGVWGTAAMPSHPLLSLTEARTIVEYFLTSAQPTLASHPLSGTYVATPPVDDNGRGAVVLRAVYTDKGAGRLPARTSEALTVLRSPRLGAAFADVQSGMELAGGRGPAGVLAAKRGGYVGFKGIDLTGITRAEIAAQAGARGGEVGGTVEIRLGSPTGTLIGQVNIIPGGGGRGAGGAPPAAALPTATALQETGGRGVIAPPAAARGGGGGAVATAAAAGFPVSNVNTAPPATAGGRGGRGGGATAPALPGAPPPAGAAAPAPAGGAAQAPAPAAGGGGRGGGRGGAAAAPGLPASLTPTTGLQDVYLVFKNDRASAGQNLATFTQVTFVP